MDSLGFIVRDRIVVDPAFIAGLPLASIAASGGTTLYLIAREVVLALPQASPPPNSANPLTAHSIKGFDVTIVADHIRSTGAGPLVVEALPAGPGQTARAGYAVNVYCRDLHPISIRSVGAKGLAGPVQTANGPNGYIQCIEDPQHQGHQICHGMPQPDPDGPRGHAGGAGGAGGPIAVVYVRHHGGGVVPMTAQSAGGFGGDGGAGGSGGPIINIHSDGGEVHTGRHGDQGTRGAAGARGAAGPVTITPTDEAGYVVQVNQLAGNFASAFWVMHRMRYADYWFRAYNPARPDRADYLTRAAAELKQVLQLAPGHTEAQRLQRFAHNHQNIVGMARDMSLVPDFEAHRALIAEYEGIIVSLFSRAQASLFASLAKDDVADQLDAQVEHLKKMTATSGPLVGPLVTEVDVAGKALAAAQGDIDAAQFRILRLKTELSSLEIIVGDEEAGGGGIELAGGGLPLFAAVATAVIGSVAIPGAAGVAVGLLLPILNDLMGGARLVGDVKKIIDGSSTIGIGLQDYLKQMSDQGKGFADFVKEYDDHIHAQDPKTPAEALEAVKKKFNADFHTEVEAAKSVSLSFSKLAGELAGAKAKSPAQKQFLAASRELVTLAQQHRQASLRREQANDQMSIAQANLTIALTDMQRLADLSAQVRADQADLQVAAMVALGRARASRDALHGHYFRAVRALDIYTLSYPPAQVGGGGGGLPAHLPRDAVHVRYDHGHVEPDVEADYTAGKLSGAAFVLALEESMPDPMKSLDLKNLADAYRNRHQGQGRISKSLLFTLSDQAVEIEALRKTGELFFTVGLDQLNPNDYECKVTDVTLILAGVASTASALNCFIAQVGRAQQRWRPEENADPAVVTQWLVSGPGFDAADSFQVHRSATDPSVFQGTTTTQDDGDPSIQLEIWGRGVAADWRLSVRLDDTPAPDLSGLSSVEVIFHFDTFSMRPASGAALAGVSHAPGAVRPGSTVQAELSLQGPAPADGAVVMMRSSRPELVRLPNVVVPAGATTASFPIDVAANAAGAAVEISATAADRTLTTRLIFAATPAPLKQTVALGRQAGFDGAVGGVTVHAGRVYASHFNVRSSDAHDSPEMGTVAVLGIDASGKFRELAARCGVGHQPRALAAHTLGALTSVYVVNYGQNSYSVSVLDATQTQPKEVKQLKLGGGIIDVAVDAARAYVTNYGAGKLHVIDGATRAELAPITLPGAPPANRGLHGLAVDADAKRIYVARSYHSSPELKINAVSVIDSAAGQVIGTFDVGPPVTQPVDVAFDSAPRRVYTANLGGTGVPPGVTVLEPVFVGPEMYRVVGHVRTIAGAKSIAVDRQREHIYVAAGKGVQVIDGRKVGNDGGNGSGSGTSGANAVIATIPTGTSAETLAIDEATGHVYVGDRIDGTLSRLAPIARTPEVAWG